MHSSFINRQTVEIQGSGDFRLAADLNGTETDYSRLQERWQMELQKVRHMSLLEAERNRFETGAEDIY